MSEGSRRLAAIMFTDMVGYTALGQRNEALSLKLVDEQGKLIRPILIRYHGREVKTMGDAFLVEFPSALEAVRCAYEIQRTVRGFNASVPLDQRLQLRIGVHLGDIIESRGDISGDAVNVASRIQPLSDVGGVCLTRQVYDHVQNKFELPFKNLGAKSLKNVRAPLEVYKIQMPWDDAGSEEPAELDRRRVAVLPLKNMSPDPNDEYFSDGMTEELITALSGVGELTVIARTSIMQYKNSPKRITEIGRELKTGTVIEGSVRKASNKVRITIQMIDAGSEGHLWAQNYDRQMDDIFAIQSEIAEKVADALKVKLLRSEKQKLEKKPTENTEAYTLYLKGRYYWIERNRASVEKGIAYLHKAIQADPSFALAYSDLADCHVIMADLAFMPRVDAYEKIREYANKALELDQNLSQPHAALAAAHLLDYRWAEAEKELKLAIDRNPNNSTARHWLARDYFLRSKNQAAIDEWRKAKEVDPLSLIVGANFGYALVVEGKTGEGIDMIRTVLDMDGGFLAGHVYLACSYIVSGMNAEAAEEAKKLLALSRDGVHISAAMCIYARTGHREEADRLFNQLLKRAETEYIDPWQIAIGYSGLGQKANALEWLEKAVNEKSAQTVYSKALPWLDSLHGDHQFELLCSRIGLT